jgi:hypothetical protein
MLVLETGELYYHKSTRTVISFIIMKVDSYHALRLISTLPWLKDHTPLNTNAPGLLTVIVTM